MLGFFSLQVCCCSGFSNTRVTGWLVSRLQHRLGLVLCYCNCQARLLDGFSLSFAAMFFFNWSAKIYNLIVGTIPDFTYLFCLCPLRKIRQIMAVTTLWALASYFRGENSWTEVVGYPPAKLGWVQNGACVQRLKLQWYLSFVLQFLFLIQIKGIQETICVRLFFLK